LVYYSATEVFLAHTGAIQIRLLLLLFIICTVALSWQFNCNSNHLHPKVAICYWLKDSLIDCNAPTVWWYTLQLAKPKIWMSHCFYFDIIQFSRIFAFSFHVFFYFLISLEAYFWLFSPQNHILV